MYLALNDLQWLINYKAKPEIFHLEIDLESYLVGMGENIC